MFGFGKKGSGSAAERHRDVAVALHRAILDAGLYVAELGVAVDDVAVVVSGRCNDATLGTRLRKV